MPEPLTIILDIDGVLTEGFEEYPEEAKKYDLEEYNIIELTCYNRPHFLSPGCIAFMRYLADIPDVTIHFFSSAVKERNIDFINQLLDLAWNNDSYNILRNKVKMFT